jgi:hypothetical protein
MLSKYVSYFAVTVCDNSISVDGLSQTAIIPAVWQFRGYRQTWRRLPSKEVCLFESATENQENTESGKHAYLLVMAYLARLAEACHGKVRIRAGSELTKGYLSQIPHWPQLPTIPRV